MVVHTAKPIREGQSNPGTKQPPNHCPLSKSRSAIPFMLTCAIVLTPHNIIIFFFGSTGRSAQIKFKTKPTSCRIPVQNKRFDICYAPEDETSEIAQDENSQGCPFSFCTVDGQGGKCHEVSGAGICTKDCKQQNTVCETPDIDAENECNAEIKKFGAVPTTGVKDREGNTLEQGTYGFCKTKRSASSDPKKYKGLSGLGRTEAEVGMLADIAIQQGFDHVKRQGDYVQVAVTPDVCQVQLDAIFVLDGSASITAPDWEATKDVVKSFIDRFDIKGASAEGEEVTRVGAVGYSRDVFIDSAFQLSKYKENAEAAKCAINAIRRYGTLSNRCLF